MKCELVQQSIPLAAYGELPEDEARALEEHVASCTRCAEEIQNVRALQQAMAFAPIEEPSANLLARTRMRLGEALDAAPRAGWIARAGRSMRASVANVGRAPAAASLLLALGIGLGGFLGYRAGQRSAHPGLAPGPAQSANAVSDGVVNQGPVQIANVSSIERDPDSGNIEVHYNRLVPETLDGPSGDPQIRQLLLIGAQNALDPSIQIDSVGLLADECGTGQKCEDGPVRKALLVALRYDQNSDARLKALNGLQSYVAEDMRVRDAVLEALVNDPDSAVRSRALELVQPVQADSSVREVLHTVASDDINPHIRTVSREVLDQLPQVQ